MIISLMEMLELPSSGRVIKFFWLHRNGNYDVVTFFQNSFLRRPGVVSSADITELAIILIKITFKYPKVKRILNYVSKVNFYLYFSIQQKLLISGEK